MDNRLGSKASEMKEIIDRALARMNTCIPGVIDSFDGETQTATVIPAVSMKTFIDDKEGVLEFPPIVNAPIVFPFASNAGFALTLPIRRGDPCIILFSQRSIDNWHDKGGIQPSEDGVATRHHDLTDAIVLMAASPIPDVLLEWEGQGIQIRNRDKTSTATVYDDKIVLDKSGTSTITVYDDKIVLNEADTSVITLYGNRIVLSKTDADTGTSTSTIDVYDDKIVLDKAGTSTITIYDDKVVLDTTVDVIIDTPQTTITGNLTVNGNMSLGADVTNVGVNISRTHVHSQGLDSDDDTQEDTGVPH